MASAILAAGAISHAASAQGLSLNYERLSSMEEPIAAELGDVTFTLTGLLDAPLAVDLMGEESAEAEFVGNFEAAAMAQLQNRWRLRLAYFGQYASDEALNAPSDGEYIDNVALSAGSAWGTAIAGNISGIVREGTRRRRGAGNALLEFDDSLGRLAEWGGGYTGRFGPWVFGAAVDDEGGFEVGATFQRPLDDTDYRLTARVGRGTAAVADGSSGLDSRAIGVVGEAVRGSTTIDLGLGLERLTSAGPDADRWFVSAGIRRKTGLIGLSIEGHWGRIAGEEEVSAALGVQCDIARGLSANLGVNHARAKATVDGVTIVEKDETKAVLSLRYSF